jgi:DNA-binding helix-hairpin-helix protein with protein kinase domain
MEEHHMSEAPVAPEGGNESGTTPTAEEFTAITSQDELNRIVGERVKRARPADYDDLKTKAARLDEIEAANQTEAEKAAARVAELESELSTTRRESQRIKIAAEHGITDADDIDLFLTGNDEETLTKQAKRLADRTAAQQKNGNRAPNEGGTPANNTGDEDRRAFVRGLTGRD